MEEGILVDNKLEKPDSFGTPCVEQKRLLVSCSSSKRSLFREEKDTIKATGTTLTTDADVDVDSDLGPMSPLALTDQSSCDSSPGRQFISPLATPEKSPLISLTNWSRVMMHCSVPLISPTTTYFDNDNDNEVVPETPSKELNPDLSHWPSKEQQHEEEYLESRLITPLGSLHKRSLAMPRLHRRKLLSSMGTVASKQEASDECTSPEIKKCGFKRHLEDSLFCSSTKQQRTDESTSIAPRARAALFKDDHKSTDSSKPSRPGFTLTPRSFYGPIGASAEKRRRKSDLLAWREPRLNTKERKSLPSPLLSSMATASSSHNSPQQCRRSAKKHRGGEINCGVWHGIKRPKYKRQPLKNSLSSKSVDKQIKGLNQKGKDFKENFNPRKVTMERNPNEPQASNKFDQNKKFFKWKTKHSASITVNDKTKICSDSFGKIPEHVNKKAKLDEIAFDATDLCVDEPNIEKSLKQSNVHNILKVLEDDWADDENEVMEIPSNTSNALSLPILSPKKSKLLKDLTMSPGSELSSMTSSMNIKDIPALRGKHIKDINKNDGIITEMSPKRLYPMFSKNYLSKGLDMEGNPRKRKRSTSSWQLSLKQGSTDNQYQIDAGQKIFGATQCNECGVLYHVGDPDDENAHLNYHNSFKVLRFQGWKKEFVVYIDPCTSSRIILVEPKDSNLYWKKVNEILEVVDRDLGLSDTKLAYYKDKRVYMYVRDKTIIGILVAEYVKSAFRIIPEISELNCCTSEVSPVKCGVNVVWTAMSHRRQGIATKLIDTLRTTYYYGYIMSVEDLAFSTPTPSGKLFAEKYTKTLNFKVY